MRIYISADLEGVAGAVTDQQLSPEGFEYERFRQFMTDEVNTIVAAARDAGAREFVISDSHGNGENLLIEQFPEDVLVVRAWPRPLGMMEGLDESFAGAIFHGYHASTSSSAGVRAHTMSSANFAEVRLNDVPVSEAGLNAAIAGHFGVPILMISGDDAATAEAREYLGDIETAVVKWACGFHSAKTMTPQAANAVLAEKTNAAMGRIGAFRPHVLEAPIRFDVRFKNYRPAEILDYLPIVQRTDSHTIRFVAEDMLEISRFLEFLLNYSPSESP